MGIRDLCFRHYSQITSVPSGIGMITISSMLSPSFHPLIKDAFSFIHNNNIYTENTILRGGAYAPHTTVL